MANIDWDSIPIINNEQSDAKTAPLDVQHTTLDGVFKKLIKNLYTPDIFKDVKGWQGVIMRVISDPKDFEYSSRTDVESLGRDNHTPIKYKVFILNGPGSITQKPATFSENQQDQLIIDALDDYSPSPTLNGILKEGDIVWISNDNYRDKVIQYSFSPTMDSSVAANKKAADSSVKTPSAAFKNQKENKSIDLAKIPDDITEDDGYSGGLWIGKVKLKTIFSYNGARMRPDAADKFNEMCRAAAGVGIKIIGVSGFRAQKEQINLYNDRYVNKYPAPVKNNTLTLNGKTIGVAAYPGTSNHQSGIAVDIDVGPHLAEKDRYAGAMGKDPRYKWMEQHAREFGFSNSEGRKVNEPWHWDYGNDMSSFNSRND